MITLPNLPYIRTVDERLYETLVVMRDGVNLLATQTGVSGTQLAAPPNIAGISVSGGNGDAAVKITDPAGQAQPNLGLHYFVEYDTNPAFPNPTVVDIGPSRGANLRVGSGTFYFRAYSSFRNSALSGRVTFGSPPTAVNTTGASSPPPPGGGSGAAGGGGGFGRLVL